MASSTASGSVVSTATAISISITSFVRTVMALDSVSPSPPIALSILPAKADALRTSFLPVDVTSIANLATPSSFSAPAQLDSLGVAPTRATADALRPNSPIMSTRYGNSPTSPSRAFADFSAPPAAASLDDGDDDADTVDAAEQAEMLVVDDNPPPAPPRRALAHPFCFESPLEVRCHLYSLGAKSAYAAPVAEDAPTRAWLHYFLPEHWSPSYKFTVFEDSYVLSFAPPGGPPSEFHLARPTSGSLSADSNASALPEFELVWPVQLDGALLTAITQASERTQPGSKRRPHDAGAISMIHHKLRRLSVGNE